MRKKHSFLFLLFISIVNLSYACEDSDSTVIYRVPSPILKNGLKSGNTIPENIFFTFTDTPIEAQDACYYAGLILESNIHINHPINISVIWSTELPLLTLGRGKAAKGYIVRDSGSPVATLVTIYENTHNTEINGSSEADVIVQLNANISYWYYGLDGNTPPNQSDLVTVILHEIIHSIGMFSYLKVNDDSTVNSEIPSNYDNLIVDSNNDFITNANIYPNNSSKLFSAITSDNLFFNESNIVSANGNHVVKIYTPETYKAGSSLTHLGDEFGSTINGLMTHKLNLGTSIHNTGPIINALLNNLGWNMITTDVNNPTYATALKLYPNPSNEFISISGLNKMIDFSIYNISGEKVLEVKNYSNNNTIDITRLNKGVYFAKVMDADKRKYTVMKFLKN